MYAIRSYYVWGDYFWQHSWEAETHLRQFGVSGTPACWMMAGYACGYIV